jgi:hypothetical protein
MRIVELNKNELPNKDSRIFPNLGIKHARIINSHRTSDLLGYTIRLSADFLVKIIREDVEYLIPIRYDYEIEEGKDFTYGLNAFVETANSIAMQTISKFSVDGIETIKPDKGFNGIDIVIYKYK